MLNTIRPNRIGSQRRGQVFLFFLLFSLFSFFFPFFFLLLSFLSFLFFLLFPFLYQSEPKILYETTLLSDAISCQIAENYLGEKSTQTALNRRFFGASEKFIEITKGNEHSIKSRFENCQLPCDQGRGRFFSSNDAKSKRMIIQEIDSEQPGFTIVCQARFEILQGTISLSDVVFFRREKSISVRSPSLGWYPVNDSKSAAKSLVGKAFQSSLLAYT